MRGIEEFAEKCFDGDVEKAIDAFLNIDDETMTDFLGCDKEKAEKIRSAYSDGFTEKEHSLVFEKLVNVAIENAGGNKKFAKMIVNGSPEKTDEEKREMEERTNERIRKFFEDKDKDKIIKTFIEIGNDLLANPRKKELNQEICRKNKADYGSTGPLIILAIMMLAFIWWMLSVGDEIYLAENVTLIDFLLINVFFLAMLVISVAKRIDIYRKYKKPFIKDKYLIIESVCTDKYRTSCVIKKANKNILCFADGVKFKCTETEYNSTICGNKYYLLVSPKQLIKIYDPEKYVLVLDDFELKDGKYYPIRYDKPLK